MTKSIVLLHSLLTISALHTHIWVERGQRTLSWCQRGLESIQQGSAGTPNGLAEVSNPSRGSAGVSVHSVKVSRGQQESAGTQRG